MKTKTKFVVALAFVLMLAFGCISASAADILATGSCGDNLTWSLDEENVLTISGTGDMKEYSFYGFVPWYGKTVFEVVIEDGVKSIGDNAFYQQDYLTTVKIADSVESIGDEAFYGCRSLTSVDMSDGVTSIGEGAFSNCLSLTGIDFSNKLTSIGTNAFYNTPISGDVNIPDGVTSIGEYAFSNTAISSVTIPEGVTSIGWDTFAYCDNLTKVVIPASATNIDRYAFTGSDNITIYAPLYSEGEYFAKHYSIPFVSTGKEAPDYLLSEGEFSGMSYTLTGHGVLTLTGEGKIEDEWSLRCETVRKIILSEGITGIMGDFTDGMESLTEITIPYTTVYIGIRVPDTLTTIRGYTNSDAQAYAKKKNLKFISLGTAPFYTLSEGTLDNISWKLTSDGLLVIEGEGALTSKVTQKIDVFCTRIKEVVIGEGITEIGYNVLGNPFKYIYINGNLEKITMPSTIKTIDYNWIDRDESPVIYCYKYSAIGDLCEEKKSYTYEFIGESPVWQMDEGTYGENITWTIDNHRNLVVEGIGAIPAGTPPWYDYLDNVVTITLSPDIYLIGDGAMEKIWVTGNGGYYETLGDLDTVYGYTNSMAETMANSLGINFVSTGVFDKKVEILSGNLTDTITYTLDSFGRLEITGTGETPNYGRNEAPWAVFDYSPVKEIIISDGITYLGSYLCSSNAETITIGNSVTGIGYGCFIYTRISSIILPDTLTEIGNSAFESCSRLVSIKIPDNVTSIGSDAFAYTSNLKWVWLSESMEAISANTFLSSGVKYIYIPASIKTIPQKAFKSCNLEHIYYGGNPAFWTTSVDGAEYLQTVPKSFESELCGVTATEKNGNSVVVYARLNPEELAEGEKMYAATYKDGCMTSLLPITESDEYAIEAECDEVRVFFWTFDGGYEPKCDAYVRMF